VQVTYISRFCLGLFLVLGLFLPGFRVILGLPAAHFLPDAGVLFFPDRLAPELFFAVQVDFADMAGLDGTGWFTGREQRKKENK
jgi:hypothetical protein